MTIGQSLRNHRRMKHWTQKELAEKINLTQKHLCELENDIHDPSWSVLKRIVEVLGFDVVADAVIPER